MADVQITFGANIEALRKSVDDAKGAIEELTAPISKVVDSFGELGAAFVEAFAAKEVAEFAEKFAEMGEDIERTSAMLGISVKGVQELNFIAGQTGTSTDGMAKAVERLELNLQHAQNPTSQQALALQALGLSAKTLIGIPLDEQMNKIADAVSRFADGGNKTAIVMALLGRSGAQMIPVLDQGSRGLEELRQKASDAAAVVSDETIESLSGLAHSIAAAESASKSLGEVVIGELSTAFQAFLKIATDVIASMVRSIQEGGLLKVAIDAIAIALQSVDVALSVAIATIETVWSTGKAAALALANDFRDLGGVIHGAMTLNSEQVKSSWADMLSSNKAVAVNWANEVTTVVKNMTAELRTAIGSAVAEKGEGAEKSQAPALAVPDTEGAKLAMQSAQDQIKAADLAYQAEIEKIKSGTALHKLGEDEKTAATISAVNRREEAELQAIAAAEASGNLSKQQFQKLEDEKTQIIMKAVKDRTQAQSAGLQADVAAWTNALKPIESAWNSQLKGLLAGTESFSQAMKNIFSSLVLNIIEKLESLAVQKLAVNLAGMFGSPASLMAGATKSISASMGQMYAGEAAFLAPTLGPGAPAAAAGIVASTQATALGMSGVASLDVGGYVLSDGLAMIHAGETVTPASVATPYQGGSGGGGDTHFHFEGGVIGTQAWINSMIPQLARALRGYQNLNPSTA